MPTTSGLSAPPLNCWPRRASVNPWSRRKMASSSSPAFPFARLFTCRAFWRRQHAYGSPAHGRSSQRAAASTSRCRASGRHSEDRSAPLDEPSPGASQSPLHRSHIPSQMRSRKRKVHLFPVSITRPRLDGDWDADVLGPARRCFHRADKQRLVGGVRGDLNYRLVVDRQHDRHPSLRQPAHRPDKEATCERLYDVLTDEAAIEKHRRPLTNFHSLVRRL